MDNANVIRDIVTNGYLQIALMILAVYLATRFVKR